MFQILTAAPSADLVDISTLNASIVAVLGYMMVFFGLVLLMCVIIIFGKIFGSAVNQKKTDEPVARHPSPQLRSPRLPALPVS